ncbi:hypothetical protein Pcinc_031848 [Petrolisthes cinctipes]|uniref:Uncharacterized protein n=1 Tax=Petrolisthes cinctipes TaxID=88211 RepID=A0AAE1EVT8_PETCI|nr:hypothetical protein Pcinc_031848 [Petrolisthes cinctipes]
MMAPRLTPYLSRLSTLVNGIQSRSVHGIAPLTSAVNTDWHKDLTKSSWVTLLLDAHLLDSPLLLVAHLDSPLLLVAHLLDSPLLLVAHLDSPLLLVAHLDSPLLLVAHLLDSPLLLVAHLDSPLLLVAHLLDSPLLLVPHLDSPHLSSPAPDAMLLYSTTTDQTLLYKVLASLAN